MKNKKNLKALNFEKITISNLKKINVKGGALQAELVENPDRPTCSQNGCGGTLVCSGNCC